MAEVWFYHLQRQPLETTLPTLLLKTIARGWRAVIQATGEERLMALDDHLWTFTDDSFLPHAMAGEPTVASQPVVLTEHDDNPNGAQIRFLVDGAELPADDSQYERIVVIFDGNDSDLLARVREQWKAVKAKGLQASYWQQDEQGRWGRKA